MPLKKPNHFLESDGAPDMNWNVNSDLQAPGHDRPPKTFAGLRRWVNPIQQKLLDEIWQHFLETGDWPIVRMIHSRHDAKAVRSALSSLGGSIVWEENNQSGQEAYHLTLLGALLTTKGLDYQGLVAKFFEFQRGLFKDHPEKQQVTAQEIGAALRLGTADIELLGRLLRLGNLSGGGKGDGTWTVGSMKEAEDFPSAGDLSGQVEEWVLRFYQSDLPVLRADRLKGLARTGYPSLSSAPNEPSQDLPNVHQVEGDPMKRRYQVFVSSTYCDLIEERKHVMQALLATKCIPSGMELLPAASTAQWNLIRSVIDDCDYYVVIVAGRYGSVGPDGNSYTEMEFDYAATIGKPILGFFYTDVRKLPGEKLEENDEARKKLADFTAKVKQRLCQSWNTPDGLASAIKSAIINAIETDPKPGWVRTNTVPTWSLVGSLQERIAQLEGRPSEPSPEKFPDGKEQIGIPAKVSWAESNNRKNRWGGKPSSSEHTFMLTWDEVLLVLAPKPGASTNRLGLLQAFTHALAKTLELQVKQKSGKQILRMGATIDGGLFGQILQTFLARKLLKRVPAPKGIRRKELYWQLSPKGMQRVAELQAITASSTPLRMEP
jgi:hypothetical protein